MFIIGHLVGCIFWGSLAAISITVGVWFLCRCFDCYPSLIMYGILVALFLLVSFQTTILTGALYVKGYVADAEEYASTLLMIDQERSFSVSDVNHYCELLCDRFPMLKPFLKNVDMSGAVDSASSGYGLMSFLTERLNTTINNYILRRILWLGGFAFVAILSILYTSRNNTSSYSSATYGNDGQVGLQF